MRVHLHRARVAVRELHPPASPSCSRYRSRSSVRSSRCSSPADDHGDGHHDRHRVVDGARHQERHPAHRPRHRPRARARRAAAAGHPRGGAGAPAANPHDVALRWCSACWPTAIGTGEGSRVPRPHGRSSVIGGVISSTFLSLIVVPVFYLAIETVKKWLGIGGGSAVSAEDAAILDGAAAPNPAE